MSEHGTSPRDDATAEETAALTAVVREADKVFERVGGSSRHWVRDCFLPILAQHGLSIAAAPQPDERVLVKVICQHCQRVTIAGWSDELGRPRAGKWKDLIASLPVERQAKIQEGTAHLAAASGASPAPRDAEKLAQHFHEAYERLAPHFGYKTRIESDKPWSEVPEQNRRLMVAVCGEILQGLGVSPAEEAKALAEAYRNLAQVLFEATVMPSHTLGMGDFSVDFLVAPKAKWEQAMHRLHVAIHAVDRVDPGASPEPTREEHLAAMHDWVWNRGQSDWGSLQMTEPIIAAMLDAWSEAWRRAALRVGPGASPASTDELFAAAELAVNVWRQWTFMREDGEQELALHASMQKLMDAVTVARVGASPADELARIKAAVLAGCDDPEGDFFYVIVGENGNPIVEADTLPDAIEQIIACWNAVGVQLSAAHRVGASPAEIRLPSVEEQDIKAPWGVPRPTLRPAAPGAEPSEEQKALVAALPPDETVYRGLSEEQGGSALYVFNRWREAGFDVERSFLAAVRHLGADLASDRVGPGASPPPDEAASLADKVDLRGMLDDLNGIMARYLKGRGLDGHLGLALQAAWIAGQRSLRAPREEVHDGA